MKIDMDKFQYKVGDKVKHKHGAEFVIVGIQHSSGRFGKVTPHYRLKNLSVGCKDNPFWIIGSSMTDYTPSSGAARLLFGERDREEQSSDNTTSAPNNPASAK